MNYDNMVVSAGSVRLGYRLEGSGERGIIMLHGLNAHSGTWKKCLPVLSREGKVVAPSLPPHRGRANSDLADRYADLVSEVCEDAGINGAVVVGNSMGGWVAMRLLSRHRRLVSSLVLEDTAGAREEDVDVVVRARIPVLIIWGREDGVLPVSLGADLHKKLPGSELRVIGGAQHVPHWERPEEFNSAVVGFLRRSPLSAQSP